MKHELYKKGDENIPDCIQDENGDITLGLCKVCGKGEAELFSTEPNPWSDGIPELYNDGGKIALPPIQMSNCEGKTKMKRTGYNAITT